jgi:hypothetical protein
VTVAFDYSHATWQEALDQIAVLRERRNWLTERIKAKQTVGWDVEWDKRECAALTWALDLLQERYTA